jgi:hypothetical protein
MSTNESRPGVSQDSQDMARYIVNGLLVGSTVSALATAVRWARLRKELKKHDEFRDSDRKDTLFVPVARIPEQRDVKAASTDWERFAAGTGAGVLSYTLLTMLANRIETNRMKKLEAKLREEAMAPYLHKVPEEKQAFDLNIFKPVSGLFGGAKNVLENARLYKTLAFLAAAAWMTKRLSQKNDNSDDLKAPDAAGIVLTPSAEV